MTDLEILEKTLELYKQQENPVGGNGWWYKTNTVHSLCLEGCLFSVTGVNPFEAGADNIDETQNTSAYNKLKRAFDIERLDTHLWQINDGSTKEFIIAGIERAIETERKLDEQVASLLPEGVEFEDIDVGC